MGDREALGQPARAGGAIGLEASRWLAPLIPANLRPIAAAAVARGLVRAVRETTGQRVLLSGQMQD
ncbi:MAG: hypothetical protein ACYC0T_11560 [Ramlibacter sp.]